MAKRRLRKVAQKVKTESSLSAPRVFATALAAITMAVVSSRLTTVVNSILLVGLVSIGSALASEFYRIVLSASARGTKKVVEPVLEKLPVTIGTTENSTDETVADSEGMTQTKVDLGEGDTAALDGKDEGESVATDNATTTPGAGHGFWYRFRHNQVLQMSLLFGVIAMVTVGISYTVARAQGGDQYNTYQTTVQQSLSDEDKQAIADQAAQAAKEQGDHGSQTDGTTQGSQQSEQTTSSSDNDSGSTEESTTGGDDVTSQLNSLQAENESLKAAVENLTNQLEAEQQKTDELAQRLDQLEQLLQEQQGTENQTTTG